MSETPVVSYIVSAFNRPDMLPCCLWSLKVQDDPRLEVIVADNSPDKDTQYKHTRIVESLEDARFRHVNTFAYQTSSAWDCYYSAEWAIEHEAKGEWFCFPSDDSYYTPVFQSALLHEAAKSNLRLVYCDMLYDRRIGGKYQRFEVSAKRYSIDKTGFFIHRDVWTGFPDKPKVYSTSTADGDMIEKVVSRGTCHGKVDEILCVHN